MRRAFVILASGLIAWAGASSANAQGSPSAAEIIERLKNPSTGPEADQPARRRTRGLSAPHAAPPPGATTPVTAPAAAAAPEARPSVDPGKVDNLFQRSRRGLSVGERREAAAIASISPAIDLTIYFDFNSAEIGPKAVPALLELGRALSSDVLAGQRFLLAGHTDAKGGNAYNQTLSERRAAAIKRFLVDEFRVPEQRLLAIGFGEEQLKNGADPFAAENRRVQVVNFGR